MERCNLTNVYQHVHEYYTQFPTHTNGSKTIDFMLGSANLLKYITSVGYAKFHKCFDSDHCGIFCDISQKLYKDNKHILTIPKIRLVGSNCTNFEGKRYITGLYNHLVSNNIIVKSEKLIESIQKNEISSEKASSELKKMDIYY
jgi:hypothetical protein